MRDRQAQGYSQYRASIASSGQMQTIVVPVQPQKCMPRSIGYAKPRNQRNGEFTITTPSISRIFMFRTGQRSNIIWRRGGMSMILSLSQHKNLLSYLFTYLLTYILIRKAMQQRQHLFSVHDKNFLAAQQLQPMPSTSLAGKVDDKIIITILLVTWPNHSATNHGDLEL